MTERGENLLAVTGREEAKEKKKGKRKRREEEERKSKWKVS